MTGNKIADKITKVSRISPQNTPETVTNKTENMEFVRKILKGRYASPKKDSKLFISWDEYHVNNIVIIMEYQKINKFLR